VIELAEGVWIAPEHVAMIKKIDENQCLLFTVGQSALEGHVMPYAGREVAEAINDYWDEEEEVDEIDQDEE
jgi:coenzyme F420-reducing hydrogenase gamma subunit